jgi:hypothetical protein
VEKLQDKIACRRPKYTISIFDNANCEEAHVYIVYVTFGMSIYNNETMGTN